MFSFTQDVSGINVKGRTELIAGIVVKDFKVLCSFTRVSRILLGTTSKQTFLILVLQIACMQWINKINEYIHKILKEIM